MRQSGKRFVFGMFARFVGVGLLCMIVAGIAVMALRLLHANVLGFTQLVWVRTWLVFGIFAYLLAIFFYLRSHFSLVLIVVTPFLTQYYQVCLGREFPEGATSFMRLLPLFAMAIAMAAVLLVRSPVLCRLEVATLFSVMVLSLAQAVRSWSVSVVGLTAWFLLGVLVPLFYLYIGVMLRGSTTGILRVVVAVSLGVWVLLAGTIGTIVLGLKVEIAQGAGTLLGTQSMGDFNTVYTYVVLAWPFAFILMKRLHWSIVVLLVTVTIAAAGLGFSRSSALITPALMGVSYVSYIFYSNRRAAKASAALVGAGLVTLYTWTGLAEVLRIWALRFDVADRGAAELTIGALLESVKPGSASANDRVEIVLDALRLFRESPLLGHGWGAFRGMSETGFTSAHNLTADLLVETGLLGAAFFWLLSAVIIVRLLRLGLTRAGGRADTLVLLAAFLLWIVVVHSLGGSLYMASPTGFQVNAIIALLLALYLRHDVLAGLVRIDQHLSRH